MYLVRAAAAPRVGRTRARGTDPPPSPSQAEARILGFEIVAKAGERWRLAYDAGAAAYTDVPDSVGALVKQRRRWLNGSFFATLYAMYFWRRLLPGGGSKHSLFRQAGFAVLFLWHATNLVLAWFTVGNTYFALRLIVDEGAAVASAENSVAITQAFSAVTWAWQLAHGLMLIWSLGNKPDESLALWSVCAVFMGLLGLLAIVLLVAQISAAGLAIYVSGVGSLGLVALCAALQGQLLPVLLSALHYLACIPLFTVLIPIYAWANTHDLSWGTRPGGSAQRSGAASALIQSSTAASFGGDSHSPSA